MTEIKENRRLVQQSPTKKKWTLAPHMGFLE